MEYKSRILVQSDVLGNDLYMKIFSQENGDDVSASLIMKLKSEQRVRNIGTFLFYNRSFHVKRMSSKHYHYKSKSYGFNWNIINDDFLNIAYLFVTIDKTERYIVPKHIIDSYGKFLKFQKQGFELQKFLPFEIMKQFRDESYNIEY